MSKTKVVKIFFNNKGFLVKKLSDDIPLPKLRIILKSELPESNINFYLSDCKIPENEEKDYILSEILDTNSAIYLKTLRSRSASLNESSRSGDDNESVSSRSASNSNTNSEKNNSEGEEDTFSNNKDETEDNSKKNLLKKKRRKASNNGETLKKSISTSIKITKLFAIYYDCNLTKEAVIDFYKSHFEIVSYMVGEEASEIEGKKNIFVFIVFQKKIFSNNYQAKFAIRDENGKEYRCERFYARDDEDYIDRIKKTNDHISG